MPVNLSIKGVRDATAAALRERAAANHRSLQGELMAIVEAAVQDYDPFSARSKSAGTSDRPRSPGRRLRSIEEISAELRRLYPHPTGGPSSTEIIRAMRDSRYGASGDRQPKKRRSG